MRASISVLPLLTLVGCVDEESQSSIDEFVVYGILDTESLLYDQHLVGLPVGPQDVTADCLLGGTVSLVGSTAGEGGTSLDLVLTFVGCTSSGSGYDLTFDGSLAWSGSFRSTGYKALATTSDALTVVGTVSVDGETDVDESCALAVTDRGEDGEVSVVSGEWCGRDVYF